MKTLLRLACCAVAILARIASASQKTLCNKDEQVLFSCNVGTKVVSFCTSR